MDNASLFVRTKDNKTLEFRIDPVRIGLRGAQRALEYQDKAAATSVLITAFRGVKRGSRRLTLKETTSMMQSSKEVSMVIKPSHVRHRANH